MPDLTLCPDDVCPRRWDCYRFVAKPSKWQSYFCDSPSKGKWTKSKKGCKYFMQSYNNAAYNKIVAGDRLAGEI